MKNAQKMRENVEVDKKKGLRNIWMTPQGCWHPLTEARMAPHTILRDLNQLLYRIFNSKKVRDNFGFLAFFQVAYLTAK